MSKSQTIIKKMFDQDAFSQWLGIEIMEVKEGCCKLKMVVRKEMLNGFHISHGGISYSLADTALAFASNTYGKKCISMETSISHTKRAQDGDILIATTKELSHTEKTGLYLITITNQDKKNTAYFKGSVYRTSKEWSLENE